MGARGDDPEPCRAPEKNSSSSRQRAQDAVILECEHLRQAGAAGGEGCYRLGDAIDEYSGAARLAKQ